jgi:Spy/CpxP family protein refolding chaperone
MIMKRTTPALCAAFLLAAAAVWAQSGAHRGHMGLAGGPGMHGPSDAALTKYLGLNDSQQAAMKQLHQKLGDTVKPLFDAVHQKRQAIKDGLDKNASAAALGQLLIDSHKIQQQIKAAHESFDKEFTALLTSDQAAKYTSFQEIRQSFRPDPGFGAGPVPPPVQ